VFISAVTDWAEVKFCLNTLHVLICEELPQSHDAGWLNTVFVEVKCVWTIGLWKNCFVGEKFCDPTYVTLPTPALKPVI
jgi:hypothetical protein